MKFYLCELEAKDSLLRIALESSTSLGISDRFVPSALRVEFAGYCLHGGTLYPIVTHAHLAEPVLKFFVVYKGFAFGVTRVLDEVEREPIPVSLSVENDLGGQLTPISRYTGVIPYEQGEYYYVYNLNSVEVPRDATLSVSEDFSPSTPVSASQTFIVLGNRYAVSKDKVRTILPATLMTPFKTDEYDGFVDYGRILPVISVDGGNYVVVMENLAYRTTKVFHVSGKVLRQGTEETGVKEFVETADGVFEVLG